MASFIAFTADTKESTQDVCDGYIERDIYLLQPNGKPSFKEKNYEGYAMFGGICAYAWLVKENAKQLKIRLQGFDEDELSAIGRSFLFGDVYIDVNHGSTWSIYHNHMLLIDSQFHSGSFSDIMPKYGKTPNELIKDGTLKSRSVSSYFKLKHPLKFSFNKDAVYEELPASKIEYI